MSQLKRMSGPERAATLLLTLGHEKGKEVWEQLDDDEIRIVSEAMARLGSVDPATVEDLLTDFSSRVGSAAVMGDYERTERLLLQLMPKDRAELIMEEIRGPAGRDIWQKLSNVPDQTLATYLKNEHPQTAAVILTKLDESQAARVLANLPDAVAVEVVHRVLVLGTIPREVLQRLEQTLRSDFVSALATRVKHDSFEKVARIFNQFDSGTEARVMNAMHQADAEAAARIRSLMFVFDDLAKLSRQDLQLVVRAVKSQDLALALKGAAAPVKEAVLGTMSERARAMLLDEISMLGPQRLRDVDKAQQTVIAMAEAMADDGRIILRKTEDDDAVLVE
ncbi:flagellar motor switch protein FliG [Alsobacter sp. SYSU M60028]|uniref:Flagellar motor switch protein FliG n=1 Tax=Alsobacter ponti TaxID=2962936 RepID=A0ABT1LJ64_9HYPH|nr:flagellar motor switch protein FliG [Alsobacter ponti]MCP8940943.1 flagellar motor switch protein FliG [Alsobacter ponti]